jgi:hypothetical protein
MSNRTRYIALLLSLILPLQGLAATQSKKLPVVPKWSRFEQSFKSSAVYSNALQEAAVSVLFVSPLGQTNQVYAFWDGGKTWRVRFAPDQPGHWVYRTVCSDPANKGLHNQAGEFLCTAIAGQTRFRQHGPVRLARDLRHFEHADGTPFFWLGDTAGNGGRLSNPHEWDFYTRARANQKFTVSEWAPSPGLDWKREHAFTGKEHIRINPEFFKRLDAKIEQLSRVGLLSAVAPIAQRELREQLPDDQVALFVRYLLSRWAAEPVAWVIPVHSNTIALWKRIGPVLFPSAGSMVVLASVGNEYSLVGQLRDQPWISSFICDSPGDFTQTRPGKTTNESFSDLASRDLMRPLVGRIPYENALNQTSGKRVTPDDVRRAALFTLFTGSAAGIHYGTQPVADWDPSADPATGRTHEPELPLWQRALFLSGAKQLAVLSNFVNSAELWRLRPQSEMLVEQPGMQTTQELTTAVSTAEKDLAFVYVPEARTVEVKVEAMPASPTISWINPRTGEQSAAVAVVSGSTCQFPTPGPGDWILSMRAGK